MINQSTCEKPDCNCCKGAETCPNDKCKCANIGFDAWLEDMEEKEQPTCDIDNPEGCENCGS